MNELKKKPMFHSITDTEWEGLVASGKNWGDIIEMFNQPSWCNYPEALGGEMGCWSLTGRNIDVEGKCKSCDCSCYYEAEECISKKPFDKAGENLPDYYKI